MVIGKNLIVSEMIICLEEKMPKDVKIFQE